MSRALYFPFSRCLDEIALKQAVLMHDELLFVDPVTPVERDTLYTREGHAAGVDPKLAQRWTDAQQHYELLASEGIVRTVGADTLSDPGLADTLVGDGLAVDIDLNRAGATLFPRRRRWQMLASRLPPSGLDARFRPRPGPRRWDGEPVVEVPWAVGSSISLTYALAIAHEHDAIPMTESESHHRLLLRRMATAANAAAADEDGDDLPGLHAPAPASSDPYLRRQVEVRLVDALAPAAELARMDFWELLDYRREHASARRELTEWIDRLAAQARSRPWDADLETELQVIAEHAREIAAQPGRWRAAGRAAKQTLSPGQVTVDTIDLVAVPTLAGTLIPHLSLLAALAVGAKVAWGSGKPATTAAIDALAAKRPPERNAVSYLLNARRR